MNVLVILAHPQKGSFNHALAQNVRETLLTAGHEVTFHDLCAEGFDPLLRGAEIARYATLDSEIARHCAELAGADGIVIIHPNWWGLPPAILTGWIDRVVRPGVAYEFEDGDNGEGVPRGLLKARAAIVLNTSNTRSEREREAFGDPLELIWKRCVFGLCGVTDVVRRTYAVVVTSTEEERATWIADASTLVRDAFASE